MIVCVPIKADLHSANVSRATASYKIRSLSLLSISYCTRPHDFISFARLKKSSTSLNFFFQLLANDDVNVSKAQIILAKTRIIVWILFAVEQSKIIEKDKIMEKSYAKFQNHRSSRWLMFFEIGVLRSLQNYRKAPVMESLSCRLLTLCLY